MGEPSLTKLDIESSLSTDPPQISLSHTVEPVSRSWLPLTWGTMAIALFAAVVMFLIVIVIITIYNRSTAASKFNNPSSLSMQDSQW
jgi:hypothetical protein